MAIMMGSLYQALVEGGTSSEAARKAAEIADYQKQLANIRTGLALVKGLLGVAVSGVLALVIKAFFV